MSIEIEHKFLVTNDDWRRQATHTVHYQQGYLHSDARSSIRIRISATEAWLNLKSATIGNHRHEYEYPIPLEDAQEILQKLCKKPIIDKTRHFIRFEHHTWEVDEFHGDNQGLVVAEVELSSLNETFAKPAWLGMEVTNDLRYYNNNLSLSPYKTWKDT